MKVVPIPREPWLAGDLLAVDRLVHRAEDAGGRLILAVDSDLLEEVSLRYQRLEPSTNRHSATDAFAALLARHRALHDTAKPLVRADLDHAHDTWQWVLRLEPEATAEVQVAALLHDVERLESEAERRIEQHAADYQAFKDAHARRGAELVRELLADAPWDVGRIVSLVADHEHGDEDPERQLLADADALSFFSLNAAGYLAYFGPEQTARKVAWTVARASPRVRPWLARIRMPPTVRAALRIATTPPLAARLAGEPRERTGER